MYIDIVNKGHVPCTTASILTRKLSNLGYIGSEPICMISLEYKKMPNLNSTFLRLITDLFSCYLKIHLSGNLCSINHFSHVPLYGMWFVMWVHKLSLLQWKFFPYNRLWRLMSETQHHPINIHYRPWLIGFNWKIGKASKTEALDLCQRRQY